MNPYAKALDVYRAKVEGYQIEVTPPMERGIFLEDGCIRWYSHRTGAPVRQVGTIRHPSNAIVMCTPDGIAQHPGEEVDLSIKVPGPYVREQWGEPGTDEVPDAYNIQVQWEMSPLGILYGIRRSHIAAPLDGDLAIFHVQADEELQGFLIQEGEKFWRDHVLAKVPPPLDGSESSARWLADRFPKNNGVILPATPDAEALAKSLQDARAARVLAEEAEEKAKAELKALIGEADGIQGAGWRALWKLAKGSVKIDWEAVAKEANAPQELIQKFTRLTKGSRRFTPTWSTK
jgi:predicted phage-related endonuclease